MRNELDPLDRRRRGQEIGHVPQGRLEVEVMRFDGELPGLELGEIENIVDDGEERLCRCPHRFGLFPLLARADLACVSGSDGTIVCGTNGGALVRVDPTSGAITAELQLDGTIRDLAPGPTPGSGEPLSLSTETLNINTPTEFIETKAQVVLRWSGHEINARGMQADLKAGKLRLESDVNGHFFPK